MDLVPYLSAVILVSTIMTILLAVLSYAAFKLRDKRKPKAREPEDVVYFRRFELRDPEEVEDEGADVEEAEAT